MTKYDFSRNVIRRNNRSRFIDQRNPLVKVTQSGVYVPETIYTELGRPERTIVAIDEGNKAFKIEPSEFGYKVRKNDYADGQANYQVITASPANDRGMDYYLGKLPMGLYKPIGGGIFEYDPSSNQ